MPFLPPVRSLPRSSLSAASVPDKSFGGLRHLCWRKIVLGLCGWVLCLGSTPLCGDEGTGTATPAAALAKGEVVADHLAANEVYKQLLETGIKLGDIDYKLPQPTLPDGLTAAEQTERLKKVAAKVSLDRFLSNSPRAPDVARVLELKKSADWGTVREIHLYFVVYGQAELLRKPGFLESMTAERPAGTESGHVLTRDEQDARGIAGIPGTQDLLAHGTFRIADRLEVSGTTLSQWTATEESLVMAGWLDQRFLTDKEYPNLWRSLKKLDSGEIRQGEPLPYEGGGVYSKITMLQKPPGAMLVETHLVFLEPRGWFSGEPFLVNKIPALASEHAAHVRRKLLIATEAANSK